MWCPFLGCCTWHLVPGSMPEKRAVPANARLARSTASGRCVETQHGSQGQKEPPFIFPPGGLQR